MAVEVYLIFDGNCREAVEYYADVFQTEKPFISYFGDSPSNPDFPMPDEAKNRVMHAHLMVSGSRIMFSDTFPGNEYIQGNNISVTVVTNDMEALKTQFNRLKENGEVEMELQETFWSKLYGMVKDKFGIHWQFSHEE